MEHAKALVLFAHMAAGILWVGGLVYVRFVLHPRLVQQPAPVRAPMAAAVGPATVRYLLRLGEITIALGIATFFVMGRVTLPEHLVSTAWGLSISIGFLGAVAVYAIGQAVTRPATQRIAEVARAVAAGSPPPSAPGLLSALAERQARALLVQAVLGLLVVLTMAVARFS